MSSEKRAKLSAAMKGNTNGHGNKGQSRPYAPRRVAGMKGKKHSPEANRKRAESLERSKHHTSKPELKLRRILTDAGFIIETGRSIDVDLGERRTTVRPDVVVGKIVFEMYGCWYHGCESCGHAQYRMEQRRYDEDRKRALEEAGYEVRIVWEHEVFDQQ